MLRVLRAEVGDEFHLIDGQGGLYKGLLIQANKRECVLETSLVRREAKPDVEFTLAIAPTKSSDRFEWMLEKAMEYGVSQIQPVWTQRTERSKEKGDRWNRILISALKQSQQLWLTDLRPAVPWSEFLSSVQGSGYIAHCEEGAKKHLYDALQPQKASWVAIGPEGDFTPDEIEAAIRSGATEVTLGPQRLRTETAGLAAIQMFSLSQRKGS